MDVITSHRLKLLGLDPEALASCPEAERAQVLYARFLERVPYENLSDNLAIAEQPDEPERWPRATDRLLRDNQGQGLGGTGFSLAYALRDLMRGAGLRAECTLGYNLVTEQAHAAVVLYVDTGPLLYDPALLMSGPVPVRPGGVLEDPLGRACLEPRCGPTLTLTLRMHCGERESAGGPDAFEAPLGPDGARPIYSIIPMPAPPQSFRQAWLASFFRGRPRPLRIARRVGDRILRYGERPGTIEILHESQREDVALRGDAASQLHTMFGIERKCLQTWFERDR
ncbi:MAG: hypothetical protein O2894_01060 [Planctomycetota bacterium]|nr:hypothetical protein [Planctomycetota bacterium]